MTLYDIDELYSTLDEVARRWGDDAPEAVSVYDKTDAHEDPDSTAEGNI